MVRENFSKLILARPATELPFVSSTDAKSLLLNILPLTRLDSIFWQVKKTFGHRNSNAIQDFADSVEKIARYTSLPVIHL